MAATGWLQVAQDALRVPGLLVEIYGDLARPGVKQVGKALETVLGLGNTILWPIAWTNERSRVTLERNLEKYRQRMEAVPEEKVVGVAPEIGVPVAEKLSYVGDDRLCDLYIRLLATASNSDTLSNAHPSFVNVINNLSPDEAHFLKYFIQHNDMPFVRGAAVRQGDGSYTNLTGLLVASDKLDGLAFPGNVDAYLSNLAGLGLILVKEEEWLIGAEHYEAVENAHRQALTEVVNNTVQLSGRVMEFKKGMARRTSFGLKFILACHSSET